MIRTDPRRQGEPLRSFVAAWFSTLDYSGERLRDAARTDVDGRCGMTIASDTDQRRGRPDRGGRQDRDRSATPLRSSTKACGGVSRHAWLRGRRPCDAARTHFDGPYGMAIVPDPDQGRHCEVLQSRAAECDNTPGYAGGRSGNALQPQLDKSRAVAIASGIDHFRRRPDGCGDATASVGDQILGKYRVAKVRFDTVGLDHGPAGQLA